MVNIVNEVDEVSVPEWVVDLESFGRWVDADAVPEKTRIWFLNGEVWVDMSKEQIFSHVLVKTKFTVVLLRRFGLWPFFSRTDTKPNRFPPAVRRCGSFHSLRTVLPSAAGPHNQNHVLAGAHCLTVPTVHLERCRRPCPKPGRRDHGSATARAAAPAAAGACFSCFSA